MKYFALLGSLTIFQISYAAPTITINISSDKAKLSCNATMTGDDINNYTISYQWLSSAYNQKTGYYGLYPTSWLWENNNSLQTVTPLNLVSAGDFNWTECQVTAKDKNGNVYAQISDPAKVTKFALTDPARLIKNNSYEAAGVIQDGKLYVWNDGGALGETDTTTPYLVPLPAKISNYYSTDDNYCTPPSDLPNYLNKYSFYYALLEDGTLFEWGSLYSFDHPNPSTPLEKVTEPELIKLPQKAVYFSHANSNYSGDPGVWDNVVILNDGSSYTWGIIPDFSQNIDVPVQFALDSKIKKVYGGDGEEVFVLSDSGSLYLWGNDYYLDPGYHIQSPFKVTSLSNITEFYDDSFSFYALNDKGELFSWGVNACINARVMIGCLGVSNTKDGSLNVPTKLIFPTAVKKLYTDESLKDYSDFDRGFSFFPFALLDDGTLYGWGDNTFGQVGVGSQEKIITTPQKVPLPDTVAKLYTFMTSGSTYYAILNNGDLYSWGSNTNGELGIGSSQSSFSVPQKVMLPGKVVSIQSDLTSFKLGNGKSTSKIYATLEDGSVYVWGQFSTNEAYLSPTKINLDVKKIILNDRKDFIISKEGKLYEFNSLNNLQPMNISYIVVDANSWRDTSTGAAMDYIVITTADNSVYFYNPNKYSDDNFHLMLQFQPSYNLQLSNQ